MWPNSADHGDEGVAQMIAKKLFGEYLVQKGLITKDQLLAALIEQIQRQPSLAQIVFDAKLLTMDQQFDVIRHQGLHACDYQQACQSLGLWNASLSAAVVGQTLASRAPLGQILAEKGLIAVQDLTKALDDYFGDLGNTQTVAHAQITGPESSVILDEIQKDLSFATVDRLLVKEFADVFSFERKQKIESGLLSLKGDLAQLDVRKALHVYSGDIHSVKGAARFVRAALIEKLCHAMEQVLLSAANGHCKMTLDELRDVMIPCLDLLWRLRTGLVEDCSELGVWESGALKAEYAGLYARCVDLGQLSCKKTA